jgi:ubiquinol-cytochrome c reductase iron-sulfur subunit
MSEPTAANRHVARVIVVLFAITTLAAVAAVVTYSLDADPQAQGAFLAVAFGGLGAGLVSWANTIAQGPPEVEMREPLVGARDEQAAIEDELDQPGSLARRNVLRRGLWVAGGAVGVAALAPITSLGPSPGNKLLRTQWRAGMPVVTRDGRRVSADEVPDDGLLTVFPETGRDAADGQVVLLRVRREDLRLPASRAGWAPDGLIAYSKVCTHAGCPVGLYQADRHELLCPCHQSSFDVLTGARPVRGPAAWPLPQLPLSIGDNGELLAAGALSDPVGPGWWRR